MGRNIYMGTVSKIEIVIMFWLLVNDELEKKLYLHFKLFSIAPVKPNICMCLTTSEKHTADVWL